MFVRVGDSATQEVFAVLFPVHDIIVKTTAPRIVFVMKLFILLFCCDKNMKLNPDRQHFNPKNMSRIFTVFKKHCISHEK
jgi:hypothetical protein